MEIIDKETRKPIALTKKVLLAIIDDMANELKIKEKENQKLRKEIEKILLNSISLERFNAWKKAYDELVYENKELKEKLL